MAQHTIPIALQTLPIGQSPPFGPVTINANQSALLTLDRTVAGGLASLGSDSTLDCLVQTSPDGGTTWMGEVEATFPGGTILDKFGQPVNSATLRVQGINGAGNRARLIATVSGPSTIAVSGSLVIS